MKFPALFVTLKESRAQFVTLQASKRLPRSDKLCEEIKQIENSSAKSLLNKEFYINTQLKVVY